jgi:hypothetical protein
MVHPIHVYVGVDGIPHERESNGEVHVVPFHEGVAHATHEFRKKALDPCGGLNPHGERNASAVGPANKR